MEIASAEFWVGISFLLFVALVVYLKVPRMMNAALDKRAEGIAADLEEARSLREEAESVLADYRRKEAEAMKEAEDIVQLAKREAESYAAETRANMKEQFDRRTKLAEEKIARAEAQAVADVRTAAVEAAVGAARTLVADKMSADQADKLLKDSIESVKSKLN
ncbi:ATP F0F1 synthase subunit B [Methyloligella sp. 2.7D]|uniref:F0F1 ATP synthase subunit B family protein n=1 Tax=unclassified Methyloligella TaxID=2625955 RepID=UPI001ABAB8C9|nr:ATP F0F1 synthase subunit B [Methyloligella sp. GL2]